MVQNIVVIIIWIKNARSMSMIRKEYQTGLNKQWILSVLH